MVVVVVDDDVVVGVVNEAGVDNSLLGKRILKSPCFKKSVTGVMYFRRVKVTHILIAFSNILTHSHCFLISLRTFLLKVFFCSKNDFIFSIFFC